MQIKTKPSDATSHQPGRPDWKNQVLSDREVGEQSQPSRRWGERDALRPLWQSWADAQSLCMQPSDSTPQRPPERTGHMLTQNLVHEGSSQCSSWRGQSANSPNLHPVINEMWQIHATGNKNEVWTPATHTGTWDMVREQSQSRPRAVRTALFVWNVQNNLETRRPGGLRGSGKGPLTVRSFFLGWWKHPELRVVTTVPLWEYTKKHLKIVYFWRVTFNSEKQKLVLKTMDELKMGEWRGVWYFCVFYFKQGCQENNIKYKNDQIVNLNSITKNRLEIYFFRHLGTPI